MDIVNLLPHIVLDDDLIGISGCFDSLDTFQNIIADVELTASPVKAIARHANYEVIAEFFCPAEEVDVTSMEEVVGAVGDDFGQWIDIGDSFICLCILLLFELGLNLIKILRDMCIKLFI